MATFIENAGFCRIHKNSVEELLKQQVNLLSNEDLAKLDQLTNKKKENGLNIPWENLTKSLNTF